MSPIPIPSKNEDQKKFISRCMSNETMKREYPDQKQRAAVCYNQWKRGKKTSALATVDKYGVAAGGLNHNNNTSASEPGWSSVDKTKLPDKAFADASGRRYPHHWVSGGKVGDKGRYTSGTMYLHKGGLNAAWAAANGAHTGQQADSSIKSHLQSHRKALGLDKSDKKSK